MRQFTLPDLGEGLDEAEIVTWYVNEGDRVVTDQPLVAVETDKAVVEIPSPSSGRIAQLFGAKGDIVKVGMPLVEFAEGAQQDAGTVVGELGSGERPPSAGLSSARTAQELQVFPAVRALARKLDVALEHVGATGPGGTITRADVERAAKSMSHTGPAEPLRGMRRAMAQRMAASHAEIAPATVSDEADIDDWRQGEDVTIRLARAIAAACKAEPALNAWYRRTASSGALILVSPSTPRAASSFPCCATSQSGAYRICGQDSTAFGLTRSRARYPRRSYAAPRLRCRISG
jgi:pyruvate dehydrogenase E2 component (dihydrolipoamide acetyltransferase)